MENKSIWLVMTGEPLEMYGSRPHRIGVLSKTLVANGYDVTWFTTTYDHQDKRYLFDSTKELVDQGVNYVFLHSATPYQKNISLDRLKNHREVALEFKSLSSVKAKPDLILCCYPTIELAYEVTTYGKQQGVKTIIDVRDLWPDIFADVLPKGLRFLGKALLAPYYKKKRYILQNCDAVTAVSNGYLDWAQKSRSNTNFDKVLPLGYHKPEISVSSKMIEETMLKFKIPKKSLKVWFVGTFGRTYDLESAIVVAKEFEELNIDVQLILSGDGELGEHWRTIAGQCKNISFTGWLDKTELEAVAHLADVGLMAYKKGAPQGLPNKIFEYMSLGIPVITSLDSEARVLIESEKMGAFYDANNAKQLRLLILTYLQDHALLKLHGTNAKRVFDERFSTEVVYNEFVSYINEMI